MGERHYHFVAAKLVPKVPAKNREKQKKTADVTSNENWQRINFVRTRIAQTVHYRFLGWGGQRVLRWPGRFEFIDKNLFTFNLQFMCLGARANAPGHTITRRKQITLLPNRFAIDHSPHYECQQQTRIFFCVDSPLIAAQLPRIFRNQS